METSRMCDSSPVRRLARWRLRRKLPIFGWYRQDGNHQEPVGGIFRWFHDFDDRLLGGTRYWIWFDMIWTSVSSKMVGLPKWPDCYKAWFWFIHVHSDMAHLFGWLGGLPLGGVCILDSFTPFAPPGSHFIRSSWSSQEETQEEDHQARSPWKGIPPPETNRLVLLMIQKSGLLVEVGCLSHYFQDFIHPSWCRMFSINSSTLKMDRWNTILSFVSAYFQGRKC